MCACVCVFVVPWSEILIAVSLVGGMGTVQSWSHHGHQHGDRHQEVRKRLSRDLRGQKVLAGGQIPDPPPKAAP